MATEPGADPFRNRLALALLGGLASVALWILTEADALQERAPGLFLLLVTGLSVWSGVALAMAGPLRLRRALAGAVILAVPAAALMWLAGQRYEVPTDVLLKPGTLPVFLPMIFIATPFLSVALQRRGAMLSYPDLFGTAWSITIRFAAAMLFAGVVWGLIYLSDSLLGIVGIEVIERILDIDAVPAAITGAALGLGIAVIHELREVVSPQLPLRLLRLLVWPILAVVAVFLIAVPLQGLSGLVGQLSPAGTLMGVALGAVTLITSAVGRDDDEAVRAELGARLLALSVPLVAGLGAWAVVMRVVQYGMTPDRALAAVVALVVLLYGLAYAVSALRGKVRWMALLRQANVWLALFTVAVCAAWLTPLLNAERWSVNSQLSRFAAGRTQVDELPLTRMARHWGKAGQAGLDRLEAMTDHPDHALLVAKIAETRTATDTPPTPTIPTPDRVAPVAQELALWIPVRPEGALQIEDLERINPYWLGEWHGRCAPLPEAPARCVFVAGRFSADLPASDQGLMILPDGAGGLIAQHVRWPGAEVAPMNSAEGLPIDAVGRILSGDFALAPIETQALELDGRRFAPGLRASE